MTTYSHANRFRAADWLAHFTRNKRQRMLITWERGVHVSEAQRQALIHSLQRFQIGEQGDGKHLKTFARRTGDASYAAAIDLFIAEEQEHSRLLAMLLEGMDAELLSSHWSDTIFVLLRRLSGLHMEILILLIAEIIAKRYYRALAEGIRDPVAQTVFAQIVRDEQGHVAFHCDKLHHDFAPLPALVRSAIRFVWQSVFRIVCAIVMIDHRAVLRAVSVTNGDFWRDCNLLFKIAADEIFAGHESM